jgi:hypothetical protein
VGDFSLFKHWTDADQVDDTALLDQFEAFNREIGVAQHVPLHVRLDGWLSDLSNNAEQVTEQPSAICGKHR